VTPAILAAERAGILHRVLSYEHDPAAKSYGTEAAEALELDAAQVFKTLVVQMEGPARGGLAIALVPVSKQLDLKATARALGARRVALADAAAAERATGYVIGGISPLGQRRALPAVIDDSALRLPEMFVSAGRRGLEIALAPSDLLRVTAGKTFAIAR
jgi:Cys-tRNA(Pro)/Cys-tRNA(Cys) deacylase